MHIGIVCWSLFENIGGIERVACELAAALRARNHAVTLLCKWASCGISSNIEALPEGVAVEWLKLDYATNRIDEVRAGIARLNLDVVAALFSWESLLWFPSLLKDTGIPLVISEHNSPERINGKWNSYERHCCLDTADVIHILLDGFADDYPERLKRRLVVIPNAAELPDISYNPERAAGQNIIIAAGRFVEAAKQFSLLLKAFALLKDKYPAWDLEICGDGVSMGDYKKLADELRLGGRLRLPGMVADMTSRYAAADIFCIPSKVEGFGMVTVEAQALELPAVGFAACSGTNEIIVHGKNGYLAEEMTPECLAGYLEKLMSDAELRQRMGKRGKEMLVRYAPEKVYDAWEAMLIKAAERKGRTRIQELEAMEGNLDADTLAAKELLARKHPFDRSNYLSMHKRLKSEGNPSPFSEREIAGFIKKQKKFGFPGYKSPLVELKRLARRLAGRA